ncbi:hypothetical protein AWM70_07940 [Paenibacillus yonginensis]|uniref:Uncharacterized protein n=1 Tax=Paenibacillus yonginensis TaxID=1462996 RepID=A0A1B1MZC3_9BACL|nr:hypothetical protein [Paenibacillus yonginensis]ANS74523.1 hypothetical protein AWM70_07940 [Paenibacillus yonginensis]
MNYDVGEGRFFITIRNLGSASDWIIYVLKTIYPGACQNEKDLQNLMDIYMDAVLYPNIYQNKEISRQEGWSPYLESEIQNFKIPFIG